MMGLGLDIGGANIKASDGEARSISRPFPLWKSPDRLSAELKSILDEFPDADHLAVTMTGELADCFRTKSEGVSRILDAVDEAAGLRVVQVWTTSGEFVSADVAREFPMLVAAANWHALATWAGRSCPEGHALLIDIGSTTTDIIPIENGLPVSQGLTDLDRLQFGELLYTGVRRTPICALTSIATAEGREWSVSAELFATTQDLYLMDGGLAESEADCNTADGRPATKLAAWNRLAHQFCGDCDEISASTAQELARDLIRRHQGPIERSIRQVLGRLGPVRQLVLSGEGEFLIRRLIADIPELREVSRISLTELLGPQHSSAACAFALARLF